MHIADSGILLYAKKPGKTSFSSLWDIKQALKTKKVGHTGTLDSFADGLLVVLSGSMTRLVSHITNFDKSYEAIICFGTETDTLDPSGAVIKKSSLPSKQKLQNALLRFIGEVSQIPPSYSAVHVNGKRASDLAREGRIVAVNPRKITIYSLDLIAVDCEETVRYAHIRVSVSKGTYIRSLARDIAYECSSCAHLVRLRRTQVGPFFLEDSCNYSELEPFSLSMLSAPLSNKEDNDTIDLTDEHKKKRHADLQHALSPLSEETALLCGFHNVILKKQHHEDFMHGKPLLDSFFLNNLTQGENTVFSEQKVLCGMVVKKSMSIIYSWVIPSACS